MIQKLSFFCWLVQFLIYVQQERQQTKVSRDMYRIVWYMMIYVPAIERENRKYTSIHSWIVQLFNISPWFSHFNSPIYKWYESPSYIQNLIIIDFP